jgi:hypothetical protein
MKNKDAYKMRLNSPSHFIIREKNTSQITIP